MSHLIQTLSLPLAIVLLYACGGEEPAESSETPAAGEASEQAPAAAEEPAPVAEAAPADDGPCPSATTLTLGGIDRSPHLEGVDAVLTPATSFADVTLGQSADLVFASYTIEADPQFGISAPTGNPDAPEGGLIFQVSITGDGDALAAGEYRREDGEAGRVSTQSMYRGSNRIVPIGDHRVQITEMTDDHVCGEIVPEEGANWPTVSGRFRIDAV